MLGQLKVTYSHSWLHDWLVKLLYCSLPIIPCARLTGALATFWASWIVLSQVFSTEEYFICLPLSCKQYFQIRHVRLTLTIQNILLYNLIKFYMLQKMLWEGISNPYLNFRQMAARHLHTNAQGSIGYNFVKLPWLWQFFSHNFVLIMWKQFG